MRKEELETLERIRAKAAERRDLEEQRIRLCSVYKSPNLSVAPKGGDGGGALERRIDAKDMLDRRIKALSDDIQTMTEAVYPALCRLPPHLYALCSTYYLSALSIDDTCRAMNRTRATFFRHQRELRDWNIAK